MSSVSAPPCPRPHPSQTPKKIRIAQLENKPTHLWAAQLMWQCHVDYSVGDSVCTKSIRFQRDGERGRAWWGCKAECMCLETEAVLIKVNPATREERSMQAYWSRPLGCGECLAGKDSLVRSLTLIHWTLIRMALPGLDASVITAFVSRSPPSPNFIFHIFFSSLLFNLSNFTRLGARFGRNTFMMHLRARLRCKIVFIFLICLYLIA